MLCSSECFVDFILYKIQYFPMRCSPSRERERDRERLILLCCFSSLKLDTFLQQNQPTNVTLIIEYISFPPAFTVCLMYKLYSLYSVHYPAYSLNVASMYLKLGRLYLGLEKKTQGVKALKKVQLHLVTGYINTWQSEGRKYCGLQREGRV